MLRLCGFRISNYHNKVRIALLEKGIEHDEDFNARPSQTEAFIARSPLGKVPFLELADGRRLSESSAICEYLEEAYPGTPLFPKDAWDRAKVRELLLFLELHVELVARRLYGQVFFGREPSESAKQSVEKELTKGIKALKALAKFDPYIAGPDLTFADCAAFCHLPLVALTTKLAYGREFLDELPQVKPYIAMLKKRPAFARVDEDRKAAQKK
ncbi:MAG TPA: glutathione S-transferase family protein [Burkholderiales bacterium]|nr:glutathione S-transferase family protein [Burkholderiales bacterium]